MGSVYYYVNIDTGKKTYKAKLQISIIINGFTDGLKNPKKI